MYLARGGGHNDTMTHSGPSMTPLVTLTSAHHNVASIRDLDLRSAGAGDLIQFIQIPAFPSSLLSTTDCVPARTAIFMNHDTVTRIEEVRRN